MSNKSPIIGRILATEKNPTTIDDFAFWTNSTLILNPFDIVKIEHVNKSYSYGVIEDISHITDAASFLTSSCSPVPTHRGWRLETWRVCGQEWDRNRRHMPGHSVDRTHTISIFKENINKHR